MFTGPREHIADESWSDEGCEDVGGIAAGVYVLDTKESEKRKVTSKKRRDCSITGYDIYLYSLNAIVIYRMLLQLDVYTYVRDVGKLQCHCN